MSVMYDEYLRTHKEKVAAAFRWIRDNIPEVLESDEEDHFVNIVEYNCIFKHDESKSSEEEYQAYDEYFYGNNRSFEVVRKFNYAWLHHIHCNPHHWQYWILHNDDPDLGEELLDMPYKYIIEMVCDWWSFSWKSGNLYEMFEWYEKRKAYIKLSEQTRSKVDILMKLIYKKLDEQNESKNA